MWSETVPDNIVMASQILTVAELPRAEGAASILVRLDLDLPKNSEGVFELERLQSGIPTIKTCLDRGYRVVVFGHIGRDPKNSLAPVASLLAELLDEPVRLISNWLTHDEMEVSQRAQLEIAETLDCRIFCLENVRQYSVECSLWRLDHVPSDAILASLEQLTASIRRSFSDKIVIECIAASNFDFSSSVLPFGMQSSYLGHFIANEFNKHLAACLDAEIVVFSGQKFDKLNDLFEVVATRPVSLILTGGAIAMAIVAAQSKISGLQAHVGRVGWDSTLKTFLAAEWISKAERICNLCGERGIKLLAPVDFVLEDGRVVSRIPQDAVQLDVGPETISGYASALKAFPGMGQRPVPKLFFNGVFGKFEDERFATGTKRFIELLCDMEKKGSVKVYVGGGEGRSALYRFGDPKSVSYAFTAGGTILKAMAGRPIKYLQALWLNTRNNALREAEMGLFQSKLQR
jgi:phosphoglycerate kinase